MDTTDARLCVAFTETPHSWNLSAHQAVERRSSISESCRRMASETINQVGEVLIGISSLQKRTVARTLQAFTMRSTESPSFKKILKKLVDTPQDFTPEDLQFSLNCLFTPKFITPEHASVFLTALHIYNIERRPKMLETAAAMLRERSLDVLMEGADDFIVDIVGTGGDGHNLFNVSTAAGIVAAGAGARVVKHGNKASTSSSGSADILQALGCQFVSDKPIPCIPFSFLLAPHYHPVLGDIASYRKSLPFRTIFNILGPLISPARPKGMVLGVPQPELGLPFAKALQKGGVKRALVVCGQDGIDEISCAAPTWAWELRDGQISETCLEPATFGLESHPLTDVKGGGPGENAEVLKTLLQSGENIPHSKKPLLDFVLMNAAALLVVAGLADSYKQGVELAYESIISGTAWKALETFRCHCI